MQRVGRECSSKGVSNGCGNSLGCAQPHLICIPVLHLEHRIAGVRGRVTIVPCESHWIMAPNQCSRSLPIRFTGHKGESTNECITVCEPRVTINGLVFLFFMGFTSYPNTITVSPLREEGVTVGRVE